MGDPAGIGPEIIAHALADGRLPESCRPLVVGDEAIMARAIGIAAPGLVIHVVGSVADCVFDPGTLDLLTVTNLDPGEVAFGHSDAVCGRAAYNYIEKAVELARRGDVAAVVTCPIDKGSLREAGYPFPGHTELIAELTGSTSPVMMFSAGRLRVALATTHRAIGELPAALSAVGIARTIRILAESLEKDFGIRGPAIAVAGLNPHAGEGGLFGDEEESVIRPAVEECRTDGIRVEGPVPADTLFHRALQGEWDGVVAMYHDQGMIPVKLIAFEEAVNVTLGLPIVRTSVGHGTAADLAGTGKASSRSLQCAIELAARMASGRKDLTDGKCR